MPDHEIICRCSDLSRKDIKNLIEQGFTTFDEIKRISRAGMGPCQGRTCMPLIMKEISRITGKPMNEIAPGTYRPPIKAIPMGIIASMKGDSQHD